MPNLAIKNNSGFIPYSKNYDEASVSDKPKDESSSDESHSEDESNNSEESPEPKK